MGSGAGLLFRDADVLGAGRCDVRVGDGQVTELGPGLARRDETVVECAGAALLPGLHDHHCHLLATAAASRSVDCGPPAVTTRQELSERLRAALPRNGWLRGVGYDDSVAGDLDAAGLDRLGPAVPTRIQHRGGALWIINGPGIRALGLDGDGITGPDGADLEGAEGAGLDGAGIERDAAGRPTGRLWRADGWLRQRLAEDDVPDVRGLSRQLASCGVTGVTDATSDLPPSALRTLLAGGFQQRITSLGLEHGIEQVGLGPRKIMVSDHALPVFGELAERIRAARPRPVALHCVTRAALVLSLAVLQETGARRGDRIEHAAVAPPESIAAIAALGLAVVTQPTLPTRRGDDYLDRVERTDVAFLWPFRSLLRAGLPVGCSSDAPYGDTDPWASVAAAASRRTPTGRILGGGERVSRWEALRGYLGDPDEPGGRLRAVRLGAAADLITLDRPLDVVLTGPELPVVRATVIGGRLAHSRDGHLSRSSP